MQGWICLHREITDHWLWQDKPFSKGQAWIDILLRANHKSNKTLCGNDLIELEKGEFITSKKKLYEAWQWSNKKLDKFLECLQKDNMITIKKHSNKIVVKVLNYAKFQQFEKIESTQKAQSIHTKSTSNSQSSHTKSTQTTMLNNNNNINNDNKRETEKDKQTDFKYINKKEFVPPSLDEVKSYIRSINLNTNAEDFFDYYSANGWTVKGAPMRDWKAMCRKWSRSDYKSSKPKKHGTISRPPSYDWEKIQRDAIINTTIKY